MFYSLLVAMTIHASPPLKPLTLVGEAAMDSWLHCQRPMTLTHASGMQRVPHSHVEETRHQIRQRVSLSQREGYLISGWQGHSWTFPGKSAHKGWSCQMGGFWWHLVQPQRKSSFFPCGETDKINQDLCHKTEVFSHPKISWGGIRDSLIRFSFGEGSVTLKSGFCLGSDPWVAVQIFFDPWQR